MSCSCKCCAAGKRCAHELVLSSRDEIAAARVIALVGAQAGDRSVDLRENSPSVEIQQPSEPVSSVTCRSCRAAYAVPEFVARFSSTFGINAQCERCR